MTDFGFFTSCRRERRGQASASASLKICENGLLNRQRREYKSLCMISSSSTKKKTEKHCGAALGKWEVIECAVTEAGPPEDVKEAFNKYAEGGTHMTAEQLRRFLLEVQGDDGGSISDAEKVVDQVHQDMTAPLSHYFIYTGHNSYLTGNQLSSDCSDVPIIKALKRGVRVVELDIWPNSTKDDVHVLHGRTLTTPVELMKCLKSIKEHAFSASPYPVVITLEDHLTPHLQAKVAKMLAETFGDMLFVPQCECLQEFPSPEELKYKIIISTKPPKEYLKAESKDGTRSNSVKARDSDDDEWGKEPQDLTADQEDETKSDSDISDENEAYDNEHPLEAADYKRLIAIHAGKPKGGLKDVLKVEPDKVRRLSLSEQTLEKAAESHVTDLVRFTQKNILRIYPKGTRFTSSNYKPLVGWMHGTQMVAFNMQGYGRAMWLMHGMFRSNGGCGYVKKPDLLMNVGPDGQVFNPKETLPVKKTLKIKVYMGDGWHLDFKQTHFDLYSPPDFYCKVGIAGVPADQIMKKTKPKEDNWTPVWEQEFTFPLTVPELALLRIEVHEYDMSEKDDFAGQTCLPVSELKPGIRAVPLSDRKGEMLNSVRLLMRFDFV
ncbi:hypothetical protein CUMW_032230 [Citrus unshiu]|nr:hypothetical protein CUMW_032230 [Citrus unshiu]